MPTLVYIDTSASCSMLFVANEEKILAKRSNSIQSNHAGTLHRYLAELIEEASISWQQIDAVCVLNGPGSYTGLRISLASAKGICFALDKPCYLLNKLEVYQELASSIFDHKKMAVLMKAREGEYFAGIWDENKHVIEEPQLFEIEDLKLLIQKHNAIAVTSKQEKLPFDMEVFVLEPGLAQLHSTCLRFLQSSKPSNLLSSEPFYLKNVYINKINKL